jgi:hypothetical protein
LHLNILSDIFEKIRKFFIEDLRSNLSLLIMSLLAFFVLSSKHIIIYNEETLVLISFIGFILLSYNMLSDSIENSLNERSLAIYNELQNSLQLKEQFLKELLEEHKKQLSLKNILNTFNQFSSYEILQMNDQRQKALKNVFCQEVQQKLKTLVLSQNTLQDKLQKVIASGFRDSVLEEFQFSKKTMKPKLLQEALRQLKIHRM